MGKSPNIETISRQPRRLWMPMYWGDYLGDTQHFSTVEHGAYLLLIGFYWINGSLPDNDESIRRITKCTPRQWALITKDNRLRSKFGDHWRHKRLDDELAKALEKSHINSANARLSHPRSQTQHNTTPSLSSSLVDSTNLDVDSESEIPSLAFDTFWVQYPHKVGKGNARKSFAVALKKVKAGDLMAALARYAAKTDDRPWCNPATWLNQERWLDQPAANNGATNGRNGRHETVIDKGRRLYERAAAIEAAKAAGRTAGDDGGDFFSHPDRGELSGRR